MDYYETKAALKGGTAQQYREEDERAAAMLNKPKAKAKAKAKVKPAISATPVYQSVGELFESSAKADAPAAKSKGYVKLKSSIKALRAYLKAIGYADWKSVNNDTSMDVILDALCQAVPLEVLYAVYKITGKVLLTMPKVFYPTDEFILHSSKGRWDILGNSDYLQYCLIHDSVSGRTKVIETKFTVHSPESPLREKLTSCLAHDLTN